MRTLPVLTCTLIALLAGACRQAAPTGATDPATLPPADAAGASTLPVATGPLPDAVKQGVEVSFVRLGQVGENRWDLEVTLRHPGASEADQISGWSLVLPDGQVAQAGPSGHTADIAPRDPPLRSVTDRREGISLPPGTRVIIVRGHSSGSPASARELTIDLHLDRGPGFSIEHTY